MSMDQLADLVSKVSDIVWNSVLLYLLVGTGVIFTIRTRFVQVRKFGAGWKRLFGSFSLKGEKAGKDGMSPFQALTTAIAAQVGVDDYRAEVLPEDKAHFVEAERAAGRTVIMLGDGINDSPALSAASVGIAISDGAAIAREIADVTIAADNLFELVALRRIAQGLMLRIHSNYRFVIGFNGMLIVLGAAGALMPAASAMLHNLSTLGISLRSMTNLLSPSFDAVAAGE